MALDTDGNLWAWWDELFVLAASTNLPSRERSRPDIIMTDVIDFASSGMGYAFAITSDNVLWGWGFNEFGELGDGTTQNHMNPVRIMDGAALVETTRMHNRLFETAAMMPRFTYVIGTDGRLWQWGVDIVDSRPVAVPRRHILDNIAQVSIGRAQVITNPAFTLAVTTDGTLWGWGNTAGGVLGIEGIDFAEEPVKIMENARYAFGGNLFSAAIRKDNSLWTWGFSTSGNELFDVTAPSGHTRINPSRVFDNVESVMFYSIGTEVIRTDGSLWNFRLLHGDSEPRMVMENVQWRSGIDTNAHWIITKDGDLLRPARSHQRIIDTPDGPRTQEVNFEEYVLLRNVVAAETSFSSIFSLNRLP